MQIKCLAAMKEKGPLEDFQYDPQPLGPYDVEVAISHCGICHSDINMIDNDWGMSAFPQVPGHEIVGIVTATGMSVVNLEEGQRVGIGWQCGACLECEQCATGNDNLCGESRATCVGNHGGFAERIRVDSRYVFPIPEKLAGENAAPLLCGGTTVFSSLRNFGVTPGMKVGVVGIGGLGHLALQFSRAWGCEVTAFSSTGAKEKEAHKFGAHKFVSSKGKESLDSMAGSLDFIISASPATLDWATYLNILKPKGILCVVGGVLEPMAIPAFGLIMGQKSVCGSLIGSRAAIREMLDFAARHGIEAKTEVTSMKKANEAVDRVRKGAARYRMVLKN